jgi:hypothetical protein
MDVTVTVTNVFTQPGSVFYGVTVRVDVQNAPQATTIAINTTIRFVVGSGYVDIPVSVPVRVNAGGVGFGYVVLDADVVQAFVDAGVGTTPGVNPGSTISHGTGPILVGGYIARMSESSRLGRPVGLLSGNRNVTSRDAIVLAQWLIAGPVARVVDTYNRFLHFCVVTADEDGNGSVDMDDLTVLLARLVGRDVSHLMYQNGFRVNNG